MAYILIIFITAVILSLVNIIWFMPFLDLNAWQIIITTIVHIVAVIGIDAIIAFLIRRLPGKWFRKDTGVFKINKWERKYYEKIGIKKWKDKIPEWGKLTSFSKSKLENPNDNEYVSRFLLECRYGELIHLLGMILGFLIIFIMDLKFCLNFAIPVALVNGFLNYPSYAILRYNRPKLLVLYERNRRLEERKRQKEQETVA